VPGPELSDDARVITLATAALAALLAVAPTAHPAGAPAPGVSILLEPFTNGLESPVFVTGDRTGSGGLVAVEQPGRLRAIGPDGAVHPEPLLDLSDRISAGGERGLLGLAFHPAYPADPRLYVDYTRAGDGASVVSELVARSDGTVDPASERILLVVPQPYPNHNGGAIAFDRDGFLLIALGDGGSGGDPEGHGQDRTTLLGSILRIDVEPSEDAPYTIPPGAPYADEPGARPELWAIGLRNPWRISVDRATGDVWIGDVGQGDVEEIDVLPAGVGGQNLGWNAMEGDRCYATPDCVPGAFTAPVAVIPHAAGACAIVGGYVYRGAAEPALQGAYLFSDTCSGDLWALEAASAVEVGSAPVVSLGRHDGAIVSFGEDDAGELYAVDHGGAILRVRTSAAPAG
jgi:glucose/arabinose dehydrogenase